MPDSGTKFSFVAAGIYTACRALKKGTDNEFDTKNRGKTEEELDERDGLSKSRYAGNYRHGIRRWNMMGRKCPGMPGCWGMPGSTAKPGDLGTPRYLGIENRPALEVIQRFDSENVFMYLDPPYLLSGRAAKQYRHEMSDADHEELLETILKSRAKIMVSGYESEMYDSYLAGWRKEQFKSCAEHGGAQTETVWMNYSKGQTSMFEMMGGCDERFDH